MLDALQNQILVQNEICLILTRYETRYHQRGALQDVQLCDSLLHRATVTGTIFLKVMHKLSEFL